MILSKKEAVHEYGNESQRSQFEKYGKFVNKNTEKGLLKTLEQHFDNVSVIKVGRANCYKLEGKKDSPGERFDLRLSGIPKMKPYTKNLDMMIISALEYYCHENELPQKTMNDWMVFFGIVHQDVLSLYRNKYNNRGKFDEHLNDMVDRGYLPFDYDRYVEDYFEMYGDMKQQLLKTLRRLERSDIIKITDIYYANGTPYKTDYIYNHDTNEYDEFESTGKPESFEVYQSVVEKVQQYMRTCHRDGVKSSNDYLEDTPMFYESMDKYKHKIKEFMSDAVSESTNINYKINYIFGLKSIRIKAKPKKIIAYLKRYLLDNPDAKGLIENYSSNGCDTLYREMFTRYLSERNSYVVEWSEKKQAKYLKMIENGSLASLDEEFFDDELEDDCLSPVCSPIEKEEIYKNKYLSRIKSGKYCYDIQNIDKALNKDLSTSAYFAN